METTSMTSTPEARRQALDWIARQLRWERTLSELRAGRAREKEIPSRQAA
jgi:hypothetical protein